MPPVGNDVVDLTDPGNRGKSGDGRFCARVFTEGERRRIAAAASPDTLLWAFWAAKEAAYKLFSRRHPATPSIPRQYAVSIGNEGWFHRSGEGGMGPLRLGGRVIAPPGELALRLEVGEGYVHALTADNEARLADLCARVAAHDAGPAADLSDLVRRALLAEVAARLDLPAAALTVRKAAAGPGAPAVYLGETLVTEGISLSHDGRFVAFALDPGALAAWAGRCRPAPV